MNQEDRIRRERTRAVQRAGELARSGLYENWQAIQDALTAEGFRDAQDALKSEYLRMVIEDHCAAARRKTT